MHACTCLDSFRLSKYKTVLSCEETQPPFQFWWGFFVCVFVYLIALVRTSSAMLKRSGESKNTCLIPDLSEKHLVFHHWISVVFKYLVFIILKLFLSISSLLNILWPWKGVEFCHFLHITWDYNIFFFIILINW